MVSERKDPPAPPSSPRTGEYRLAESGPDGYWAFHPNPLPPKPPVRIDAAMQSLLDRTNQALGRLDGITLLLPDPDQFILLAESDKPMSSPGYDHLGLLQDSRDEVDRLLEECERFAEKDDRVKIIRYEDLEYPGLTVHAFYVKYLLPVYFDVQSMDKASA